MSGGGGEKKSINDLLDVMAALRTPVTGCPWDLAQSFETIVPYTIEEAYEVADAIDRKDFDDLRDELGDLLFQVVFYAQLAKEDGTFRFEDVVDAVTTKMIRRHPHVFGDAEARSEGQVRGQWEEIKAAERAEKNARKGIPQGENSKRPGILDEVPGALPSLSRAVKLQSKAAKVGFDWPGLIPVMDKLREELGELEEEIPGKNPANGSPEALPENGSLQNTYDWQPGQRERLTEELGDVLFVMANIARHLDVDPEAALRGANKKFVRRFQHIEARLAEAGRTPEQSDLAEMDRYWNEAKALDKDAMGPDSGLEAEGANDSDAPLRKASSQG